MAANGLHLALIFLLIDPESIYLTTSYLIMPLYTKLPSDLKEVDVIIAGGGLAGCVVAGRLAEASRDLSILVIEQGPNSYNVPEMYVLEPN